MLCTSRYSSIAVEPLQSVISTYVLFQGEWLYSFGLAGLVAMVPFVGLSIRWLQDRLTPLWTRDVATKRDLLRLTVATVFIAGLPNLLWGGTFNCLSRALIRAAILALVVGFPSQATAHTGRAKPSVAGPPAKQMRLSCPIRGSVTAHDYRAAVGISRLDGAGRRRSSARVS